MIRKTTEYTQLFNRLRVLCGDFFQRLQLSLFDVSCRHCHVSLVFPHERVICSDCAATITINQAPQCSVCGRPLEENLERCGECLILLPPFRKHVSYARYSGLLRKLILTYKYGGIETLKFLFVQYYMELFYKRVQETFDYIIAVPPDSSRGRDFDHIHDVALLLARHLHIPLLTGHLVKVKKTLPQARLSRAKRLKNLHHAFQLRFPHHVKGKKILLIDDVYTTGTTLRSCAALLVQNQADVVAMTLAYS